MDPLTLEEARRKRYGITDTEPDGFTFQEGYCAYNVLYHWGYCQCTRKSGHGPSKLYCKQHARMVKEEE